MSKRKRQKNMKRGYLKRWSSERVNVGTGLNKAVIAEYHARTKSIGVDIKYEDAINRFFGVDVGQYSFISPERQRCISNVTEIVTRFDHWKYVILYQNRIKCVKKFFSGNNVFFVLEDKLTHKIHRSVTYNSTNANWYYQNNKIAYVKHDYLPTHPLYSLMSSAVST